MKITKRQLKRIIKEAMSDHWDNRDKIAMSGMALPDDEEDYYETRHQDDQKDLTQHREDTVFEIIEDQQGISGKELVDIALKNSVFGGATDKDVHATLDSLLRFEDVRFNVEEDEWYTRNHGML